MEVEGRKAARSADERILEDMAGDVPSRMANATSGCCFGLQAVYGVTMRTQ